MKGSWRQALLGSLEHFTANEHPLYLGRSLVDAEGANVPVQALDDFTDAHSTCAMELEGMIDHALRELGGAELGHRGNAGHATRLGVALPRGAVRQQRRRVDV